MRLARYSPSHVAAIRISSVDGQEDRRDSSPGSDPCSSTNALVAVRRPSSRARGLAFELGIEMPRHDDRADDRPSASRIGDAARNSTPPPSSRSSRCLLRPGFRPRARPADRPTRARESRGSVGDSTAVTNTTSGRRPRPARSRYNSIMPSRIVDSSSVERRGETPASSPAATAARGTMRASCCARSVTLSCWSW